MEPSTDQSAFSFWPFVTIGCFSVLSLVLTGCDEKIGEVTTVYENSFDGDITDIEGGKIVEFLGSRLLGNYNNDGFTLVVEDLPDHSFINVQFDLYIHDSWDGNVVSVGGPDVWWMEVERGNRYVYKDYVFATTFSNTPCDFEPFCLRQSYPNGMPFSTNAKSNISASARGLCHHANRGDGTSIYRIDRVLAHSGSDVKLIMRDSLKQDNAPSMICDESWSIDNLIIRSWD